MWYRVKARDMGIFKPKGKVITFSIFADDENHLWEILTHKKNCKEIKVLKHAESFQELNSDSV
tara:strand:- start:267 stop:455 length:189 start_codon:yes stop_codon:yes gene_type:complete